VDCVPPECEEKVTLNWSSPWIMYTIFGRHTAHVVMRVPAMMLRERSTNSTMRLPELDACRMTMMTPKSRIVYMDSRM